VTEGKTDIAYLKSALKNLYKEYPDLITKHDDGTFEFKVSFLKKTKRLRYFLGIYQDGGGSALNNLYKFFDSKQPGPDYLSYFKKISKNSPKNPVFLMFDNEIESKRKKPIGNFLNLAKLDDNKKETLKTEYMINIIDNLYALTVPLIGKKSECEIEDLFDDFILSHKIDGREFTKNHNYDNSKYYGKEIFSNYILNNYFNINFNEFKPILDNINNIIKIQQEKIVDTRDDLESKNTDKSSASKVPLET